MLIFLSGVVSFSVGKFFISNEDWSFIISIQVTYLFAIILAILISIKLVQKIINKKEDKIYLKIIKYIIAYVFFYLAALLFLGIIWMLA